MARILVVVSVLLLVALAASGCCCCCPCGGSWGDDWRWPVRVPAPVGELRTDQKSVPADRSATSAQVQIAFGGGKFTLQPGADGLLDGAFTYNVADLAPKLESQTQNGVQIVKLGPQVDVGWGGWWDTSDVRNEWSVRLGRDVPMTLRLDLGAFDGSVDLGGLRLRDLEVNAGACNGSLTFSEPNPETLKNLVVNVGAANLALTGLGNARFQTMRFTGGAGKFDLSFDGAFQGQSRVRLESGMSTVTIRAPREVGVRVELDGALSTTHVTGFSQNGNVFTNSSYEQGGNQLTIVVTMAMGDLTLESR